MICSLYYIQCNLYIMVPDLKVLLTVRNYRFGGWKSVVKNVKVTDHLSHGTDVQNLEFYCLWPWLWYLYIFNVEFFRWNVCDLDMKCHASWLQYYNTLMERNTRNMKFNQSLTLKSIRMLSYQVTSLDLSKLSSLQSFVPSDLITAVITIRMVSVN